MRNKNIFLDSVLNVSRFFMLIFCLIIVAILFLFSVKFDFKNYDIVVSPRLNSSTYYGIEYSPDLEVWKIERSKDGSMCTRRLFP
ncbi:MAG: hypothetical protein L6416_08055 [Candidatus Omnitrophica bacterium]|nr:hypothetical protein [Candidatus Omnitrophota bacterium]